MENKIYLTRKKPATGNEQNCIKLTSEAMSLLVDLASESNMPLRQVASQIILQSISKDLIRFSDEVEQG